MSQPLSAPKWGWHTIQPVPPEPGSALAKMGMDREKAMADFHGQAFRAVRAECFLGLRETAAAWDVTPAAVTALERGEQRFASLRDFRSALEQLWRWGEERNPGLAR